MTEKSAIDYMHYVSVNFAILHREVVRGVYSYRTPTHEFNTLLLNVSRQISALENYLKGRDGQTT
jgi:hypothetical protein